MPSLSCFTGQREHVAAAPAKAQKFDQFVPCQAFSGMRPGWVFKEGGHGLGYYRDGTPGMFFIIVVADLLGVDHKARADICFI